KQPAAAASGWIGNPKKAAFSDVHEPAMTFLDARWRWSYISGMVMKLKSSSGAGRPETVAERIRHEALVIAEARAEIAAGKGIDDEALETWLDALDHDENTPLPTRSPIAGR
ncbi:MAG TPA: hypothetical protein VHU42_14450, partial [Rhodopila sp.]|nr:hypothetical protein [Rhodopila sp.]